MFYSGVNIKIENKHQAIGFEEALSRVEDKVKVALENKRVPTIAVENILLQQNEQWYDLSVLLFKDPDKEITLQTFTQMNPIPLDLFLDMVEKEMPGYAKGCDSVEKLLAAYLQTANNTWQQTVCGVSRKETLQLAAKTLVFIYKNRLTGYYK